MTGRRRAPMRLYGAPHATAVVTLDLLPGTHAYVDTHKLAPPILVIDTGPVEVQFSMPCDYLLADDLKLVDDVIDAWHAFRTASPLRLE